MRAHYLFLACLALLAGAARGADDAAPEAAASPAASPSAGAAATAAVNDEPKEAEMLDVAESSNNNTAAAEEEGGSRSNTKRTIDHSLGYGYRYNTVLRPVPAGHHHHYLRRPMQPVPMYKLQQRYPHHFFSSSAASGSGASGAGAPFRFSQPLPSPPQPQREQEPQVALQQPMMHHGEPMAPMAPRPVTEAPSGPGPHSESVSLYRALQPQPAQPQPEQHPFAFEDDLPKPKQQQQQQSELEAQGDAQPVQYADEAPAHGPAPGAHSYQQLLQAEPTYYLTSAAAASPAASHMFASSSPLAMYGHAMAHAGHPVMYATAGGQHAAATQMIPVIIVRLMDSQTTAATLSPSAALAHAVSPMGHALGPLGHAMGHAAVPYPLVSMQYLRDYLSKLYAPAAPAPAQPQYVTASEPDPLLYSSQLFGSTQLQKLQLQQQLHAQLQKQLQMQVQQQQQQQQRPSQSVAEILQEQHRQRVAAAQAQQGRTEVTVHRSPAMSPQDYKESVEQQEEA